MAVQTVTPLSADGREEHQHSDGSCGSCQPFRTVSDTSPIRCATCAQCCQTGRGIPVDITVAAEFFHKSADSNTTSGRGFRPGEGLEADIKQAVWYYRRTAGQSHPAAMYNFRRCLEYHRAIERTIRNVELVVDRICRLLCNIVSCRPGQATQTVTTI
jgi:TPR repeat protein